MSLLDSLPTQRAFKGGKAPSDGEFGERPAGMGLGRKDHQPVRTTVVRGGPCVVPCRSMSLEGLERTWGWGRAAGNVVCSTSVLVSRSWSRSSLNHLISDP